MMNGQDQINESLVAVAARGAEMLSHDEEIALARAWRDHSDTRARDRLIKSHIRMILPIARQFARRYGASVGDLVSEGTVGMIKGLDRYDPELGYRFSTYIGWWVRAEIRDYVERNVSVVRPRSRQSKVAVDGESPRLQRDVSLDMPVGEDEGSASRQDTLIAPDDQEALVIEANLDERRRELYAKALEMLTPRERMVIVSRHGEDARATLEDLSQTLGVSRERIRQIEAKAIEKLMAAIKRFRSASFESAIMAEARLVKAGRPITPLSRDDKPRAGSLAPRLPRVPACVT
ncbi:MAG: sigma-70 family RNA polymerase sigma factor [Betaproteobacteria bacterium]|uniref:sigma-70 family RNA polymerase sigma factor n=2 Tax=Acidiphilium TaxID=522 RepID=UPI00157B9B79|nr:sigma-70 family RNA polymerase sigma factor [Acidiphilium sp. C61]MDE2343674.1 sigma-70 family RNA polymerase sigma factor [Betaproteobacteria bacterium]UNC16207.1 sigma-70 family RNA polymerase sigma factor [Acidiphilium multivorum]